jgi:hypothetical protein
MAPYCIVKHVEVWRKEFGLLRYWVSLSCP